MSDSTTEFEKEKPIEEAGTKEPLVPAAVPEPVASVTKFAKKVQEQYNLDATDKRMCEHLFENPNVSIRQLAALTNISKSQCARRLKKPAVLKRLKDMKSTGEQLAARGEVLAMRVLINLLYHKDSFIVLQAAKLLTQRRLNVSNINVNAEGRFVYEVQIGQQGQVIRTQRPATDPSGVGEGMQTTLDLIADVVEAEARQPAGDL